MKNLTFVSRYNQTEVNVRLSDDNADKLLNNKYYSAIELYLNDVDRVSAGYDPFIFSKSQIRKLRSYLTGIDCWHDIIVKDK